MKLYTKIEHKHSYTLFVKCYLYVSCEKHGSDAELRVHMPD
jgi:hypothetical protein